jgi:hypothetical protein
MQAFEVHWLQWLFAGVFIGLTLAAFLYLGFFLPNVPGRPSGREAERESFAVGIEVTDRGIPPVLLLLYLIFFIFVIAYVAYLAIYPVNF